VYRYTGRYVIKHKTPSWIFRPAGDRTGGRGREKGDRMKNEGKARAEDVKICEVCGKTIVGEYDWVLTRRRTKLYFCKGMKCKRSKSC